MKLKYNFYVSGVLESSFMTRDELICKIASYISNQESFLMSSQADSCVSRYVAEIEKVFEDVDFF